MALTAKDLLRLQGAHYVASGLLPLVSMDVFERLTGKKKDRWLVQMVALLAICIGSSVALGARKNDVEPSTLFLSVSSALSFASIDVVHATRRRISPIYLADALIEAALLCALARSRCR